MEFVAATPVTGFSIAAAATPTGRTILMLVNVANISAVIKQINVSFSGVSSSDLPAYVELVKSSQATNGTNGTAITPVQWRGQGNTSGAGATSQIAAYGGYVSEPTVLTMLDCWWVPPTTGTIIPLPLGDEPELIMGAGTMGLGLRVTLITSNLRVAASMRFVQGLT